MRKPYDTEYLGTGSEAWASRKAVCVQRWLAKLGIHAEVAPVRCGMAKTRSCVAVKTPTNLDYQRWRVAQGTIERSCKL